MSQRIYNAITTMQCLPFSWTTLRGKHCWHPIAVMGVVNTFEDHQFVVRQIHALIQIRSLTLHLKVADRCFNESERIFVRFLVIQLQRCANKRHTVWLVVFSGLLLSSLSL